MTPKRQPKAKKPDAPSASELLKQVVALRADQAVIRRELETISLLLAALSGPSEFDKIAKSVLGKDASP